MDPYYFHRPSRIAPAQFRCNVLEYKAYRKLPVLHVRGVATLENLGEPEIGNFFW